MPNSTGRGWWCWRLVVDVTVEICLLEVLMTPIIVRKRTAHFTSLPYRPLLHEEYYRAAGGLWSVTEEVKRELIV